MGSRLSEKPMVYSRLDFTGAPGSWVGIFLLWEGLRLGNKRSLVQTIHDITGIPHRALRDEPLNAFGVEERFSWAQHRETKRTEDKAYSLLGLFDVQMPLLYGEGSEKALLRLRKEIDATDHKTPENGLIVFDKAVTPEIHGQAWKPRYYFFYGSHTRQSSIARALGLIEPPAVYRAFLKGYSVANLVNWRVLLNGPAHGVADGVAYKVEYEWHESKLILGETSEYVPGLASSPCSQETGGWRLKDELSNTLAPRPASVVCCPEHGRLKIHALPH